MSRLSSLKSGVINEKKKISFLIFLVIFLSACGDSDIKTVVKNIDKPSTVVTEQLYTLAKECWEKPNKIADIEVKIKESESYETVITKEDKTITSAHGDYNETVIGAHYVTYDTHGIQIVPKYASLATARIKESDSGSTVIIYSVVKSVREDILYWIDYVRCK